MASSSRDFSNNDSRNFETDPSGRYVRYDEIIGKGITKIVYKGFDRVALREIAWCKTQLTEDILKNRAFLEMLLIEPGLMKLLDHENIVKCYVSWIDEDAKTIHMITEYFPAGNLVQYLSNHKSELQGFTAIKNWSRQILNAVVYLHSQTPPIVHRDIKGENIYIDRKTGCVKLGDFGFALFLEQGSSNQKFGTPRYMAPEIHQGKSYNEVVDIYSFGLSVLEMITREPPYSEFDTKAEFLSMVEAGVEPVALSKVTDPAANQFISKCLAPASERLSASELLNDPFLAPSSPSITTVIFRRLLAILQRVCCIN